MTLHVMQQQLNVQRPSREVPCFHRTLQTGSYKPQREQKAEHETPHHKTVIAWPSEKFKADESGHGRRLLLDRSSLRHSVSYRSLAT